MHTIFVSSEHTHKWFLPLTMDLTITNCIFAFSTTLDIEHASPHIKGEKQRTFLCSQKIKMRNCNKINFLWVLNSKAQAMLVCVDYDNDDDVDKRVRVAWLIDVHRNSGGYKYTSLVSIFGFLFANLNSSKQNTTLTVLHFFTQRGSVFHFVLLHTRTHTPWWFHCLRVTKKCKHKFLLQMLQTNARMIKKANEKKNGTNGKM